MRISRQGLQNRARSVGATALLALACLGGAALADPSAPVCGQVVTQDLTLTADLTNCAGDGLVIGAPNVTVNLGGHAISGAPGNHQQGIDDRAGYPGLTVTNGTITGFAEGVVTDNHADGTVVSHLTTSGMLFSGVLLQRSAGGSISYVEADSSGQAQGLVISGMSGAEIDHSDSAGARYAGIYVYAGDGNLIDHDFVTAHNQGMYIQDATNTSVTDNHADASAAGDGIDVVGSSAGSTLSGNHADGNAQNGIDSFSSGVQIGGNHADANSDLGIVAAVGDTDAGNNHAQGNGNPLQCTGVGCMP